MHHRPAIAPQHRNAAAVMAIAVAMVSLFAVSYSLALGRPTPHNVPIGVVGSPAAAPRVMKALQTVAPGGLRLLPYPSRRAAVSALANQRIYGVLVFDRRPTELLYASAAGSSVARLLQEAALQAANSGTRVALRDLHPLPAGDPSGLVSFYVTLAATILGFVTMFQLRANASPLSLRAWLGCVLILAVTGGLMLSVVAGPIIGALRGPFAVLWATLAAQIAVAALFNATMLTLIGRWAMIPTWGLFVALGNAASGGAVAPPLLPPFYDFIGRFLPTGATVEIIRNAVYFGSNQHAEPILVQLGWLVAVVLGLLASARLLRRTPSPQAG